PHDGLVPHPHKPAEHPHKPAEHSHFSIIFSIIIGIVALIMYQYAVSMRIRKLEKNMEKISQIRIPTLNNFISLMIGIIGIIAASMPIIIRFLGPQGQEASQKPAQQQEVLREDTNSLAIARSEDQFLEDRLAAILSLPGKTVETKVIVSQENIGKWPSPTPENLRLWPRQTSFSIKPLPIIKKPRAG
ncbi:MAG: hypothetical protein TH68_09450, partial [Candidatus Synechococcus spongiarum 142]